MKFIGVANEAAQQGGGETHGEKWVGVLSADEASVARLATVDEFWADAAGWQHRAATASGFVARDGLTEIPYVPASARILCIGLNYRAHAAEGSFEVPDYPTIFGRWVGSLAVGGDVAPVPEDEAGLDWEGEVAVYIGTRTESVDEASAGASVFGYSTFNDLTARRAQKLTAQWTLGKNGDFTGPMGPLVSADEVGPLSDGLSVVTRVNGTEVQNGNTRDLIFSVESIIALVSRTLTLQPGDVIVSGTPEGVGYVRTPPWLLGPGDVVEVEVEKLGTLTTPIGDHAARSRA